MSELARLAGIGRRVKFDGHEVSVHARTLGHWAEMDAEIQRLRGDPFRMVIDAVKESYSVDKKGIGSVNETVAEAVAKAVAQHFTTWRTVSFSERGKFQDSARGRAFGIWMALRDEIEGLTLDRVELVVMEVVNQTEDGAKWLLDIEDAIDQASGEDTLGNWTGPRRSAGADASGLGEKS